MCQMPPLISDALSMCLFSVVVCTVKFYALPISSLNQKCSRSFSWRFPSGISTVSELSSTIKIKVANHKLNGGREFSDCPTAESSDLQIGIRKSTGALNRDINDSLVAECFHKASSKRENWIVLGVFDCAKFLGNSPAKSRSSSAHFKLDQETLTKEAIMNLSSSSFKGGNLQSLTSIQQGLKLQQSLSTTPPSQPTMSRPVSTESVIRQEIDSLFSACSSYVSSSPLEMHLQEKALYEFRVGVLQCYSRFMSSMAPEGQKTPTARQRRPRSDETSSDDDSTSLF